MSVWIPALRAGMTKSGGLPTPTDFLPIFEGEHEGHEVSGKFFQAFVLFVVYSFL